MPQGGHGLLRSVLLTESQNGIQDDDRQDGYRILEIAEGSGRDRRDDEDDDQKRGELLEEDAPGALDSRLDQLVGPVVGQPSLGLLCAQAKRVAVGFGERFVYRDAVPIRHRHVLALGRAILALSRKRLE